MTGSIYLRNESGLVELREAEYDSETVLQQLLADYPKLLAGEQMDTEDPRRLLLVKREMGVPGEENSSGRWSLDHLFLDQDGVPTLIEVKRSTDTRIRREVVGQMLDYAANAVVYWPVDRIQTAFEATCQQRGDEPDEVLLDHLEDEELVERFWPNVQTNLQAGKIRMVFVADVIPPELRRVVEFLNEQMNPAEVLALEVKQYTGQGLQTLVPRVVGQTETAHKNKAARKPYGSGELHQFWTSLLDYAKTRTPLHANISPGYKSWVGTRAGFTGFEFNYVAQQHTTRAELYIDRHKDSDTENKLIFDQLEAHKQEIEEAFGGPLSWERLEGKRACRVAKRLDLGGYRDEERWADIINATVDAMIRLEAAVHPFIAKLSVEP